MNKSLALAGLLAGFQFALGSAFAHSATEPAPRPDKWWQDRHAGFNTNVAALGSKSQVIFIGDSITQGWEGEGKEVWAKYYAHRNAINLGIGGDRTQHVLWRLENGNLAGLKPKAAVVMIGTNNSNGEDNTPEQIVEGVRAIVSKLRATLPDTKVLLVAIFPRSENFSVQRGKLAQINQVLRRAADEQNVFWVDFGHRFLNDDGTMPKELMPDYLHLSPKGYAIWAEAIEAKLAAVVGDSPVKATAAASGSLTGEWVLTMAGPDGQPIDFPTTLQQDGATLTGRVARGQQAGKFLEIRDGKVEGNKVSWTIKRDREGGDAMVYQMTGTVEGGKLTGKTDTTMDGNPISTGWTAKRK
jgi:beta-glucosidase